MAAIPVSEQSLPARERTPIAGLWRRLAALVIDGLTLGVPALLLGLTLFHWASSLGRAGRLIGFVVALLYFGVLNSRFGGGQTLGKRLLGIRVADRAGAPLSPMRSFLRLRQVSLISAKSVPFSSPTMARTRIVNSDFSSTRSVFVASCGKRNWFAAAACARA